MNIFAAIKDAKVIRSVIIALLVLAVPLVGIGLYWGLDFASILLLLVVLAVVGFPVIMVVASIGAAVGLFGTHRANMKNIEKAGGEGAPLAELEKKRAKAQMGNLVFWVVTALASIGLGFAISPLTMIGVALVGVIVYVKWIMPMNAAVRSAFKQDIVGEAFRRAFTDVTYDHNQGFSRAELEEMDILYRFDGMDSDDWVDGQRNGLHFFLADLGTWNKHEHRDDDGNRRVEYEDLFKGQMIRIESERAYPAKLLVVSPGFSEIKGASGDLSKFLFGPGKNDVELESEAFNKRFDTYCADQVAARVVLPPGVMEELLHVGKLLSGDLAVIFVEKRVYILHGTRKNQFELKATGGKSMMEHQAELSEYVDLLANCLDCFRFTMIE